VIVVRSSVKRLLGAAMIAVISAACGDSPTQPGPNPNPNPPPPPPVNNTAPAISAITVQGTRRNQPANFADVSESVPVVATVTDVESNVDTLQYNWTATLGTFSGSGRTVSWVAPAALAQPVNVTITLEVVERFGTNQENKVSRTATVALHDSVKEVGDMSVRFLTEFSKPQSNKDVNDIMRDFKASACPDPGEIEGERQDVIRHYSNFEMHSYEINSPQVTIGFGGSCFEGVRGDACVSVAVRWDSTNLSERRRATTTGTDYITSSFSTADNRWWLCSSRFRSPTSLGHQFYLR
jgi:hypothetical protein